MQTRTGCFKFYFSIGVALILSACSNPSGSSFLSDNLSSTQCASSGCAPTDTNAYLSLKKTSTYYVKPIDRVVEVNGDCFLADSVSHTITLNIKQGLASFAVPYRGINLGSSTDTSIKCTQGKFGFILDISGLNTGVYTINGKLNLIKADGSAGLSTGSFTANLSVSVN